MFLTLNNCSQQEEPCNGVQRHGKIFQRITLDKQVVSYKSFATLVKEEGAPTDLFGGGIELFSCEEIPKVELSSTTCGKGAPIWVKGHPLCHPCRLLGGSSQVPGRSQSHAWMMGRPGQLPEIMMVTLCAAVPWPKWARAGTEHGYCG